MKRNFLILSAASIALLSLVFTAPAIADDAELVGLVKSMQKRMDSQDRKIEMLESRSSSSVSVASAGEGGAAPMSDYEFNQRLETATGGANKWLKDLKFSGDFRLRYEAFQYTSGAPTETDDRNRFRYRLRYGFEKKFSEDLKAGFAMASGEGSSGTGGVSVDPTSTNTTFDNNFNFKNVYVEKAYATYSPSFLKNIGPIKKTEFGGGKFNNPFEKGSSDMIWDRDVKPEGIYEKIDFDFFDTENIDLTGYVTAGQFVLDEDASVEGDANLYAFQLGLNPTFYIPFFERPVDLLHAFSFYNYDNYARNSNFLIGGTSLARGNPNADALTTELDAGRFQVFESYTELGLVPIFNTPTRAYFDFAVNARDQADSGVVSNENHAYAVGVKLGSIVQKNDWELSWAFKRIGANAVVGAFNDSDFGDGHAGKYGNVIKGGYALMDNVTLNSSMFFVRNLNSGTSGIIDQEQYRFQVDLVWKFA